MVQAIGAVLRHEGVKNALGTVRDKATAAKIRASGGVGGPAEGQLAELDLACRKATSHEDIVPKEKHIITLKNEGAPAPQYTAALRPLACTCRHPVGPVAGERRCVV